MREQLIFVEGRDGKAGAIDFAKRTLAVYRGAARQRKNKQRHFAHVDLFRPHFVRSILEIRAYLKEHKEQP